MAFNDISARLTLFYTKKFGNRIHCTFIRFCLVFYARSYRVQIIFRQKIRPVDWILSITSTPSRVDQEVMAMKGYSKHPRSLEIEPYH